MFLFFTSIYGYAVINPWQQLISTFFNISIELFEKGETDIYNKLLSHYKNLTEQISAIQDELSTLPPGTLYCTHNGNYTKWYHQLLSQQFYIPKKEKNFAQVMARKKYLELKLQSLSFERQTIRTCIDTLASHPSKMETLFQESSPYCELFHTVFQPISTELNQWMNADFEYNIKYPEQRIHKSASGLMVRSKSEALIATLLSHNRIPFRYECALCLGETTLHPDFTLRHPKTGTFYYWEHFGLMDFPSYRKNVFSKLQLYTAHNIIPSIQLITTYETSEHPFDSAYAEQLIHYYFGD